MKHLISVLCLVLASCSTSYYLRFDANAPARGVFDGNVLALEAQGEVRAAIVSKASGEALYEVSTADSALIVARLKPKESEKIGPADPVPAWAQEMVGLLQGASE